VTDDTRDVETTETAKAAEDVADDSETDVDATETEVDDSGTEVPDSATEVPAKVDSSPKRTQRTPRGWSRALRKVKVVPVVLVLLLLMTGGLAAWLYFERYHPNRQTDPSVERAVVNAASDGTVALLSYSPESLDKDFANAKSHLSGDFLSYYNQFTDQIVAPAAKQKSLKTTARVIGAGLSELHPNSAVVLVFVDQSTTSKDRPDPAMAASSVLVSMTRVNGNWLITKFDPV
jgi:Mce-associated membrane protein